MDLAMSYIMEADKEISQIKDVSLFDAIFTEGSDTAEAQNSQHSEKSAGLLRKAINVIRGIYEKIKTSISNFIEWFKLDGAGKANYEKFVKECQNNPEFANMKITVKNWKAINATYDKAEKEMQKKVYAEVKRKEESRYSVLKDIQGRFEDAAKKAATIGKDVAVELTISEALEMAKQSQTIAESLKMAIDIDSNLLNEIEKEIGEAETKKLTKKLTKLSSDSKLVRWMAGARKRKYDVNAGSAQDIMNKVGAVWGAYKRAVKRNPDLKNAVHGAGHFVVSVGKNAVQDRLELGSKKRALEKEHKRVLKRKSGTFRDYINTIDSHFPKKKRDKKSEESDDEK